MSTRRRSLYNPVFDFTFSVDGHESLHGFGINFTHAGGTITLPVVSKKNGIDTDFSIETYNLQSWATAAAFLSGSRRVEVTTEPNTSNSPRSCSIRVVQNESYNTLDPKYVDVSINQAASPYVFIVNGRNDTIPSTITNVPASGITNLSVPVTSTYNNNNQQWLVGREDANWITTSALGEGTSHSFSADANPDYFPRTGRLNFVQGSSGLMRSIDITQNAATPQGYALSLLVDSGTNIIGLRGSGQVNFTLTDMPNPPSVTLQSNSTSNVNASHAFQTDLELLIIAPAGSQISYLNASNTKVHQALLNSAGAHLTHIDFSNNGSSKVDGQGYNALTLNISGLSALNFVDVRNSNFSANGLNNIFNSLHSNSIGSKSIYISGNPGTASANISIAQNKGWTVYTT